MISGTVTGTGSEEGKEEESGFSRRKGRSRRRRGRRRESLVRGKLLSVPTGNGNNNGEG